MEMKKILLGIVLSAMVPLIFCYTTTYNCYHEQQVLQIPHGHTDVLLTIAGAQGASQGGSMGGKGATFVVQLSGTPGTFFHVDVGCVNGFKKYVLPGDAPSYLHTLISNYFV